MAGPELPPDFPDANDDLADTPLEEQPAVAAGEPRTAPRRRIAAVAQIRGPVKTKAAVTDELEQVPPHNFEVEQQTLSLALVDPPSFLKMRDAGLLPGDFYSGTYACIYDAMLNIPGGKVDILTVANDLKQRERLAQIGGMAELTRLHTGVGGIAQVDTYIQIIRELSGQRKLLTSARLTVAELYAHTGLNAIQIAGRLRQEIERLEQTAKPAIEWMGEDDLFAPEPAADLVIPKLGIGPGPAASLFGYGYSGKSIAAFAMGLAVAAGKDVWGAFSCKPGVWAHFDYEQGKRRTKTVFQRLCKGMGIWREQLVGQVRMSVLPTTNLTTPGALSMYTRALEGVTFATMDALRGMTPGVDENDSAIREHIDMLGRVSQATGCTILLIHHAGKTKDSERPRKESGRGSSAIFDAVGTNFVLSAEKGRPTKVSHEKDRELGFTLEDFGLAIEDVPTDDGNTRGGLRVRYLDLEELLAQERKLEEQKAKLEKTKIAVLDVVKEHAGIGMKSLRARLPARGELVDAAVEELVDECKLIERGRGDGDRPGGRPARHFYTKEDAPPAPVIAFDSKKRAKEPPPDEDADD